MARPRRQLSLEELETARISSKINNIKQNPITYGTKLSTVNIGAIAELMVCENLLRKGYEVFRSVSGNSKCDLVAINRLGKCIQIEVKAARRHYKTGKIYLPKISANRFDVLAVVTMDGIRYEPSLEEQ